MSLKLKIKEGLLPKLNAIIGFSRLQLRTKGDPNRSFLEFIRHLGRLGLEPKTVIDVGVAFGTHGLYTALPRAKYYLVEPVPTCAPILKNLATRLDATIFNVAAGDVDGEIEFNVHDDISGSSALKQVEGELLDGKMHSVPVRRLDSIIPEDLQRPVLLKIDTQGYEIPVLKGAKTIVDKLDVIIVECSFHQFRHGAPELADIITCMDEFGFAPYETLEGHYRPVDGAMAQIDVAFVPKNSILRQQKGMFTPDQLRAYVGS